MFSFMKNYLLNVNFSPHQIKVLCLPDLEGLTVEYGIISSSYPSIKTSLITSLGLVSHLLDICGISPSSHILRAYEF